MKPVPRNDHTAFEVSDIDESIRFYTEKLRLNLLFSKIDLAGGEAFAFLELEGGSLELIQMLDRTAFARRELHPPYCPHLALRTEDLEATLHLASDAGIPLVSGPHEIPGEVRWVYLADPDNNVIEFIQWIKNLEESNPKDF